LSEDETLVPKPHSVAFSVCKSNRKSTTKLKLSPLGSYEKFNEGILILYM